MLQMALFAPNDVSVMILSAIEIASCAGVVKVAKYDDADIATTRSSTKNDKQVCGNVDSESDSDDDDDKHFAKSDRHRYLCRKRKQHL
jgi:hypothetical protein